MPGYSVKCCPLISGLSPKNESEKRSFFKKIKKQAFRFFYKVCIKHSGLEVNQLILVGIRYKHFRILLDSGKVHGIYNI